MTPFCGRHMKKKRAALPSAQATVRRHLWLCLQLVAALSVLAFLLNLLRIQSYSPTPPPPRLLRFQNPIPFSGEPKIAFLFLARAGLPLDFVWHNFFKNARVGNFSIYVHSKPGFKFDQSTTRSPFFYGRHVNDSVQVDWGEATMIEAERLLLRVALEDPANQRFVLVSDSCVPLYNYDYVYNYLISSPKSFVDSFLDKKERRYNEKMAPSIPKNKWRKGSQWITLVRRHAEVLVDDDVIFPIFKMYCKRLVEDLDEKHITEPAGEKRHSCIPDEHYVPTLLSMMGLEDELERRTLTYTLWNHSKSEKDKRSWHPVTFQFENASSKDISKIKALAVASSTALVAPATLLSPHHLAPSVASPTPTSLVAPPIDQHHSTPSRSTSPHRLVDRRHPSIPLLSINSCLYCTLVFLLYKERTRIIYE